jgi:hypothetical protein
MVAERGSITKGRDDFIKAVRNPKYAVRLVFSGHVHRNGLYVVHPPAKEIYENRPKDIVRQWHLAGALVVRGQAPNVIHGVRPPAVTATLEGKQGPLYVTTTSAGPRGSFEDRELVGDEVKTGKTTDPGWARIELATDGSIKSARFMALTSSEARRPIQPAVQRDVAVGQK